jgi:hypothetical protein
MEDCIRNGSACAGDADFANTARAHGIKLGVRNVEGGARIKRELLKQNDLTTFNLKTRGNVIRQKNKMASVPKIFSGLATNRAAGD